MLLVRAEDHFAQRIVPQMLGAKISVSQSTADRTEYQLETLIRPIQVESVGQWHLGKEPYAVQICPEKGIVLLLLNQDAEPRLSQQRQKLVSQLLPDPLQQLVRSQHKGRGGTIALTHLPTDRVLGSVIRLPADLIGNSFIANATGFTQPVTHYGTSWGAANTFELLQTLKVGATYGTPVVFENYDHGLWLGFYAERAMKPSFQLLGFQLEPADLGLDLNGKFTQPINPGLVAEVFGRHNLSITQIASQAASQQPTVAGWFRQAMSLLSQKFLALLGIELELAVISCESILSQLPCWHQLANRLAEQVEVAAGHPVSVFHTPDNKIIRSNQLPLSVYHSTIAELHQQGWWLGGAAIYYLGYRLGLSGGIIQPISDGRQGNVHLLAKPFLQTATNGLFVAPVNLFWLPAEGQVEDGCIDPWVLLELMTRWENIPDSHQSRAHIIARQIWELIEVPLTLDKVGQKTIATVGLNGLNITTER